MEDTLQILASNKIDPVKWNNCIAHSQNALIYANYDYLDALCDQWSALVIGNYKTILPLPWRKKWGIRYLYAPAFIQQLGFFGDCSNLDLTLIWNTIYTFAKYGDLFFNNQNELLLDGKEKLIKTNYLIALNQTYPEIAANYSNDLQKNLQKAAKTSLRYSNELLIDQCVDWFQEQYQTRFPHYTNESFHSLKKICTRFAGNGNCFTRTVYTKSKNELVSTALILNYCNRLYLIMNATNQTGRKLASNHFLIDQILQEFSEEELWFDFEGSEKNGIKEFYESFHPINQPYYQVSYNQLPNWVNWIRKKIKNSTTA